MRLSFFIVCAGLLAATAGCSRKSVRVPTAAAVSKNDNSYMDLEAGGMLRIVVPAADSRGYDISNYDITAARDGVRLRFASAERTRNGKAIPEPNAPPLPFQLPRRPAHIRLIYLVRVSEADHNMAIVAAKRLDVLNAFTKRLKESPTVCEANGAIFCAWVPARVAVRPERLAGSASPIWYAKHEWWISPTSRWMQPSTVPYMDNWPIPSQLLGAKTG